MFMSIRREGKTVATLFISDNDHVWRVYSVSSSHCLAADLRFVADKLDELNGVHPE
ncbi:MAG: hypothetical protein K2P74_01630 [Nitrosomonas sp.]|nr:hypothetical protein [Nitrosomonas sp.]